MNSQSASLLISPSLRVCVCVCDAGMDKARKATPHKESSGSATPWAKNRRTTTPRRRVRGSIAVCSFASVVLGIGGGWFWDWRVACGYVRVARRENEERQWLGATPREHLCQCRLLHRRRHPLTSTTPPPALASPPTTPPHQQNSYINTPLLFPPQPPRQPPVHMYHPTPLHYTSLHFTRLGAHRMGPWISCSVVERREREKESCEATAFIRRRLAAAAAAAPDFTPRRSHSLRCIYV